MLFAQCDPLTTEYDENNGQDGIMFDITAAVDVTITGFDCNLDLVDTYDLEIYAKQGSHVGFTMTPGSWTLVGTATGVNGLGSNNPTSIPIVLNQAIAVGQTAAFYITSTDGNNVAYGQTGTTPLGNVAGTDGNITVWDGTGKQYPFDTDFVARTPNITVYYDCCPPPDTVVIHNSCSGLADGSIEVTGNGVAPWTYELSDISGVLETSPTTSGSYTFQGLAEGQYVISCTDNDGCNSTVTVDIEPDAPITVDTVVVDNLCYGGSLGIASINVNGGTAPFNIVWSDAFANQLQTDFQNSGTSTLDSLSAGTYIVVATDAVGCFGNTSVVVSEPAAPLVLTLTAVNLNCFESGDGELMVAYDGVSPYVYELLDVVGNPIQSVSDPSDYVFTGLEAGTYFVTTTDANGCATTDDIEVLQPDELEVEISMTPVLCFDGNEGTATITSISGGTPPYGQTVWDDPMQQTGNTATGLRSGTYVATAVDANGCEIEAMFEFDNPPPLTLTPSYLTDTCGQGKGAAVIDAVLGTPPYSYLWKPDSVITQIQYDLSEGVYEVVVTDANNCKDSTTVEVKDDLPYPFAAFEYRIEGESMVDQEVQFVNNSVGTTQWTWNFGNGENSNEENPRFHFGRAGDYLVQLISSTGYCEDTAYQYVNIDPLLTVYVPNAFTPGQNNKNDYFFPQGEGIELESYDMFIFDRWGKIVWQTGNFSKKWDGSNLEGKEVAMGTYFYKITFREYADLDRHVYTGEIHLIRD